MSAPHEIDARERKCKAIAFQVIRESAGVIEAGDESMWKELAKRAEVNMPSEESKKRILELLKGARLG